MAPRRVAIYARVSTDHQTIQAQLHDLREYCRRKGWTQVQEFADEDVSGAAVSREHLDAMMAMVRRGRFDAVLVWKYDRYARSAMQLIMALDELKGLEVDFVSVMDNIDTTTPLGRFMFQINAGYAELERSNINERVRMGVRYALEKGVKFGRAAWTSRPGYLSEDQIARVRELAASGFSQREIARNAGLGKGTVWRILNNAPHKGDQNVAMDLVDRDVAV